MQKLYIVFLILILVSCGSTVPNSPILRMKDDILEEYNTMPVWEWDCTYPNDITQYRLRLDDDEWIVLTDTRNEYRQPTPLAPGEHIFELQAGNLWGRWSASAISTFRIAPMGIDLTNLVLPSVDYYIPNDPLFTSENSFNRQWNLDLIGIPEFWQTLEALDAAGHAFREVRIAVIDTGSLPHPDLSSNQLSEEGFDFISNDGNAGEEEKTTEYPGIDDNPLDTGDGQDENDPETDWDEREPSWHGTSVAGVIAAATGNARFLAGMGGEVAPIRTVPIRVLGREGGSLYDISQAILYAAGLPNNSGRSLDPPAQIINLSLGIEETGPDDTDYGVELMEAAMEAACEAGVLIFAAAGNEYPLPVTYPANSPFTIAVAAVGSDMTSASYSAEGSMIDLAAPGGEGYISYEEEILLREADDTGDPEIAEILERRSRYEVSVLSAVRDPDAVLPLSETEYTADWAIGTSIAAPHAAGAFALLLSLADPGDEIGLLEALSLLQQSCTDLYRQGRDARFGYGVLDVPRLFAAYTGREYVSAAGAPLERATLEAFRGLSPSRAIPASRTVSDLAEERYSDRYLLLRMPAVPEEGQLALLETVFQLPKPLPEPGSVVRLRLREDGNPVLLLEKLREQGLSAWPDLILTAL